MTTLYVHIFGSVHNSFSHYQHCSDLWPLKLLKVKRDRMLSNYAIRSELFLDDFVCSYLRFSARLVQCVLWRHIIPPSDSVKQYQLIPHNRLALVITNIVAIYGLWKSSEIVYYQITQLSEQKYKLAIPFAEHAIFLFESLSITLCGVFIFSSLYLQICIF
jgi:hypothetical protein